MASNKHQIHRFLRSALLVLASGAFATVDVHSAEAPDNPGGAILAYVREQYTLARSNYIAAPTNVEVAWKFSKACFDWAENAAKDEERAQLAGEGIAVARRACAISETNGAVYYYLALNLGQLAKTRTLGALPLISEMEKALRVTERLDPRFDYAGAHRGLGVLYLKAPGWPTSVGNKRKARQHLQKAIELAGDYPGNRLALISACLRTRSTPEARQHADIYRSRLPEAKQTFSGLSWKDEWIAWDEQWAQLSANLAKLDD